MKLLKRERLWDLKPVSTQEKGRGNFQVLDDPRLVLFRRPGEQALHIGIEQ